MKIAILHTQAKVKGGAVKMLFTIANLLKNKHNVDFYTFSLDRDNCFFELNKDLNIINLDAKGFKKIIAIIKLGFMLKNYDIILAGNSPMHFAAVLGKFLSFLFSGPVLKTFWYLQNIPLYYMDENKSFLTSIKRIIEKKIISELEIISNSKFIGQEVKKYFQKDSHLLYPCVDIDFFKKNIQDRSGNQDSLSLFVNSRLVKGKNIELAIKTFLQLRVKYLDLKLFIAGDGEEREKLEMLGKKEKGIIFLGEISPDEVRKYYSSSTVYLFTSLIDAFGLTIIEAMSVGKPVVSLAIGGPLEIITSGIDGYLAVNDADFIDKVEILLNDGTKRDRIGINAKNTVLKKFSLTALDDNLNKILF